MAAPTKAISDYTCALAAIESLTIDRSMHHTQQALIEKYPEWCNKGRTNFNGHLEEGALAIQPLFFILKDLNLASSFIVGTGRQFLQNQIINAADGIFIYTMNHPNGTFGSTHCWRVHGCDITGCAVVNTAPNAQQPYAMLDWQLFDTLGCTVLVCRP